jgi:hypothetical protein
MARLTEILLLTSLLFLLPYLYFLLLLLEKGPGRGSSVIALLLAPVLIVHGCIVVFRALRGVRSKELAGANKWVAWIASAGSILVGLAVAIIAGVNETGC